MNTKFKIIIVDDDNDDREIIRDAFETAMNEDMEYVFIENGEKLIDYLQGNDAFTPSLIMLDLNMPGKDGRETLKEIKSHEKFQQIPTIIFTTSSSARDKQIVYALGANCFITKPDTFNKLIEITKSIGKLWLQ